MVLNFGKILNDSFKNINFHNNYKEFPLDQNDLTNDIVNQYGEIKWLIINILNQQYNQILTNKFDLYNWLNRNEKDEVSYFLNETGSNIFNYSEEKRPYKFHLWLGDRGFIIGIEQKGKGFNAKSINTNKIKDNEGAAFNFYRQCRSNIFFDDPENARIIYLEYLF